MNYFNFHCWFTIPVLLGLCIFGRPFLKKLDIISLCFLNVVAILYTIPWDSFIIRKGVWYYDEDSVFGTVLDIPFEEISFFSIQTTITGLFSIMIFSFFSSPIDGLMGHFSKSIQYNVSILILVFGIVAGFVGIYGDDKWMYLSAILWWVSFPLALLTYLSGSYFYNQNWKLVTSCIVIPTVYLSIADSYAINRGIWKISPHFTVGVFVPFLNIPIEELLFFLVSNILVVLGLLCCMRTYAISYVLTLSFPDRGSFVKQSEKLFARFSHSLIRAMQVKVPKISIILFTFMDEEDILPEISTHLRDIKECRRILELGSLSFNLASKFYPFPIRDDIQILYAFLRVADDLMDDYSGEDLDKHLDYLGLFIDDMRKDIAFDRVVWSQRLKGNHGRVAAMSLMSLLRHRIDIKLLDELFSSFMFDVEGAEANSWIEYEKYCAGIAGSVGRMVLDLIYSSPVAGIQISKNPKETYRIANNVGICLQHINVARDVLNDAKTLGRCYTPLESIKGETRRSFIMDPELHREKALKMSKEMILRSRFFSRELGEGIKLLPTSCQIPIRLGILLYQRIGELVMKMENPTFDEQWRVVVPKREKILILGKVLCNSILGL